MDDQPTRTLSSFASATNGNFDQETIKEEKNGTPFQLLRASQMIDDHATVLVQKDEERSSSSLTSMVSQQQQDARISEEEEAEEVVVVVGEGEGEDPKLKKRKIKYLTDASRAEIINRIEQGERQSDLAKEFGVTRAAVCYLNKKRDEIRNKNNRLVGHSPSPASVPAFSHQMDDVAPVRQHQHSKLYEKESAYTPQYTDRKYHHPHQPVYPPHVDKSHPPPPPPPPPQLKRNSNVYQVQIRSMDMHFSSMRSKTRNPSAFRDAADRATRILLEEAFAFVAKSGYEIESWSGHQFSGMIQDGRICGISLGEAAYFMLQAFRTLEPTFQTGMFPGSSGGGQSSMSNNMWLPRNLELFHWIFLLLPTCRTGRTVYNTIKLLREQGVREKSIVLVTLLASAEAVNILSTDFPCIQIVVGAIDQEVNYQGEILPGVGNFIERYSGAHLIHKVSRESPPYEYHGRVMDQERMGSRSSEKHENFHHHTPVVREEYDHPRFSQKYHQTSGGRDKETLRLHLQQRQFTRDRPIRGPPPLTHSLSAFNELDHK